MESIAALTSSCVLSIRKCAWKNLLETDYVFFIEYGITEYLGTDHKL